MNYSNPRTHLQVNDWPYGNNRVKAIFTIEQTKRGERATRATENPRNGVMNNPKKTTYSKQARIVDGEDGRTYIAELTEYGQITIMQSNLKYQEEVIYTSDDRYSDLLALFN